MKSSIMVTFFIFIHLSEFTKLIVTGEDNVVPPSDPSHYNSSGVLRKRSFSEISESQGGRLRKRAKHSNVVVLGKRLASDINRNVKDERPRKRLKLRDDTVRLRPLVKPNKSQIIQRLNNLRRHINYLDFLIGNFQNRALVQGKTYERAQFVHEMNLLQKQLADLKKE